MANSNFVVHNGLTVGPTTIDAASGNIAVPVGKQISVGNVLLFDNGDGKLRARDITNNSDVSIVATLSATSTTQGNIQIGTNHLESTNTNGVISFRPNGTGALWFTSNTIDIGRGGVTTISTGGAAGYAGSNIALSPGQAGAGVGGYVIINGNLQVNGTQTVISTNNASFTDGMVYYADGNSADSIDLGFVTAWTNVRYQHGGFVRDASDSVWKLFGNVVSEPTTTVDFTNATWGTLQTGTIQPGASNVYTLGSTTNWWLKSFTVAATAQYADLAENYVGDTSYEPGTVVEFGGANEVTLCDSDMSSRVAGVVSTNPAYLMNGAQTGENIVAVALTGRVPTKVRGPIRKGDLIVSAGEGYARAETLPQVGTVIGKALEDFDGDAGVIEVVVGKH